MSRANWKFGAVIGSIVMATGAVIASTAWAQVATTFEPNTDRFGSDYFNFQLPAPQPSLCQQACVGDANCSAWTYVQPGVQGPQARCYLKNPAPPPTPSNCCVSGAKTEQPAPKAEEPAPPNPPGPPSPPGPPEPSSSSCDQLWVARNSIYKMRGYCFKTQRAISRFGNAGCIYRNENDIPLTPADRAQIAQIRAQERAMGCQ
jgi:PAN domain/YARHG domain